MSRALLLLALVAAVLAVPVAQLSVDDAQPRAIPNLRWGKDGHIMTGMIAQTQLSGDIAKAVAAIIPAYNGQLGLATDWADEIKQQSQYFWSSPLHFINTPDWACNFEHSRDCDDNFCVSGAISNYTERLSTQTGKQQEEALKFLVHFIGDIHQPLHVGFTSDMGGNTIHVEYEGHSRNLHSVWDSSLIFTAIDNDFNRSYEDYAASLAAKLNTTWADKAEKWLTCSNSAFPCPDEWAEESISIACSHAYVNSDGVTHIKSGDSLAPAYYERVRPILDEQLAKAGLRMAATVTGALHASKWAQQ